MTERALFASLVMVYLTFTILCTSATLGLSSASAVRVGEVAAGLSLITVVAICFWRQEWSNQFGLPTALIRVIAVWGPVFVLLQRTRYGGSTLLVFYVSLAAVLIYSLAYSLDSESSDAPTRLLVSTLTVWLVATTYIWLGLQNIFPFAREAYEHTSTLPLIIDIRVVTGAAFCVSLATLAFVRSWNYTTPEIPDIPVLELRRDRQRETSLIATALIPIIFVANSVARVLTFATNVIWHIVAATFMRLFLFGIEIGIAIRDSLLRNHALLRIVRLVVALPLFLATLLAVLIVAEPLTLHVTTKTWRDGLPTLLPMLGLAFTASICLLLTLRVVSNFTFATLLREETLGVTTCLMAAFIASVVMLLLQRVDRLVITGYQHPGPFTTGFGAVVAVGLISWLARNGVVVSGRTE